MVDRAFYTYLNLEEYISLRIGDEVHTHRCVVAFQTSVDGKQVMVPLRNRSVADRWRSLLIVSKVNGCSHISCWTVC